MQSYLFVVVTRTNTVVSRIIRFCTHTQFNHVSLSFDKGLEDLVSFGRLHPWTPIPGGFVHEGRHKGFFLRFQDTECRIYAKKVDQQRVEAFREQLQRFEERRYAFNNLGLLTLLAGIPLERKHAYFCSQFCGAMLEESGIYSFSKAVGLLRPADFCEMEGFYLIFTGLLQDFDEQKVFTVV